MLDLPRTLGRTLTSLGLLALGAASAQAQGPVCDGTRAGIVACVEGRLCACGMGRGSAATGLPDGMRWDCGILRPRCGGPLPATVDPYLGPLPEALSIESNTNHITTNNRNRMQVGDEHDRKHPR